MATRVKLQSKSPVGRLDEPFRRLEPKDLSMRIDMLWAYHFKNAPESWPKGKCQTALLKSMLSSSMTEVTRMNEMFLRIFGVTYQEMENYMSAESSRKHSEERRLQAARDWAKQSIEEQTEPPQMQLPLSEPPLQKRRVHKRKSIKRKPLSRGGFFE